MSSETIKGAFYPSWDGNAAPASIQTQYFTHIFYAFLNPDDATFQINISQNVARQVQNFNNILHAKTPPVKTLFSVGGAKEGTEVLSRMASTTHSRAAFIRSTIDVARRFGFDGVDLDWVYPSNQMDMGNLGSLLEEWRVQVRNEARGTERAPLLLTATVYFSAAFSWGARQVYPAISMNNNLDFINVMTFDYCGDWETSVTGAHAALYDPNGATNMSTQLGLESWIQAGVQKRKLIMGLPLYGRTWTLSNPASTGIGARAVGLGLGDSEGIMTYAEVVAFNGDNRPVHDEATVSVYSVAGLHWISYDDTWSVRLKIEYARRLGVGGHFFWDVCGDHEWTLSRRASESWRN